MKSITVNLAHSKQFFLSILYYELKKYNQGSHSYQDKCAFSEIIHNLINKLNAPSNVNKQGYYALSIPECINIMLSVSDFDMECFKKDHGLHGKGHKQSLISDYYNSRTLIRFWNMIGKAGFHNQNLDHVMQPVIYRNNYLKNLLNK